MHLNMRSLLAHQVELRYFLRKLETKGSKVDVVLLHETFLKDKIQKLVNIPDYEIIANNRQTAKGAGTAILTCKNIPYRLRNDLVEFQEKDAEMTYIELSTKVGKSIVLGSLYRSPNTQESLLVNHITKTTNIVKSEKPNKQLVMGMDHNLDLLKSDIHTLTRKLLDSILNADMLLTITRPTRIMQHSATLIDNIFLSDQLQRNFNSAIIVDDISDHLPCIALMKQTHTTDKSPLEFESRSLTLTKIDCIKNKLLQIDWNGMLNSSDCNTNFDKFCDIIKNMMDEVAPTKTIQISPRRRFMEPWMTPGLESAINKNKKKCNETLKLGCRQETIDEYKKGRNLLNRLKRTAMQTYYRTKCINYKSNTKKLWQVINQMISECKNSGSIIPFLSINGIRTNNPKQITNKFGSFYSSLGSTLASKIPKGTQDISHYMQKIPRTVSSMLLTNTTQHEIEKLINDLPNKTSCRHNKISNSLLKDLKCCISYPLMVVFNQSIASGTFLDKMKLDEIIPLYKGKERDEVINYCPISLLMTISKLLEKIIYVRTYSYLEHNHLLFNSQYGFQSKRSCDQAILELTGKLLQVHLNSLHSAAMFLDLSKAFDTLSHSVLLSKMERYGIRGLVNEWFRSYLTNRSLVAKVPVSNNRITYSNKFEITYGTAQGNCLGPLLFIIFCNDIHLLPLYGHLILFADDTTLINS